MDSWQEQKLQSLLCAQTESDLFTVLAHAARELGFEKCAYGMRLPLPVSNPKVILINNYPSGWQESYVRNNYLQVDPTVAHGARSIMPLIWSDDLFVSCRDFWEEARAFDLKVGWAQSCHDPRGIGGLLTLARSHDNLSKSELGANSLKMSWLAQAAHEGLSRLHLHRFLPEADVNLTAREIEVMRWTAEGKTSGEVGEIMNISESTVNFHVNNAVSKLGVNNKTAAAIKAVMLRLL